MAALLCWGGKKLCWVTCLVLTAGFFACGNGTALQLAKPTRTCFCALTTHPHLAVGSQKSDASFAMRGRCAGQLRIQAPPPSAPFSIDFYSENDFLIRWSCQNRCQLSQKETEELGFSLLPGKNSVAH